MEIIMVCETNVHISIESTVTVIGLMHVTSPAQNSLSSLVYTKFPENL